MTIQELKQKIEELPDEMEVVCMNSDGICDWNVLAFEDEENQMFVVGPM
jgi:hypothetical protein